MTDYVLTNAAEIFTNSLTLINDKEYLISDDPASEMTFDVSFIEGIGKGSYKFVFLLYDEDIYIGEYPVQIIVVD